VFEGRLGENFRRVIELARIYSRNIGYKGLGIVNFIFWKIIGRLSSLRVSESLLFGFHLDSLGVLFELWIRVLENSKPSSHLSRNAAPKKVILPLLTFYFGMMCCMSKLLLQVLLLSVFGSSPCWFLYCRSYEFLGTWLKFW